MFINFNEIEIYNSLSIDYFNNSKEEFTNIIDTKFSGLENKWTPFNIEGQSGADVQCQLVHIGKKLEGNSNRLRIAVYEVNNRMDTVILFQTNQISQALAAMESMAGYGELICCE